MSNVNLKVNSAIDLTQFIKLSNNCVCSQLEEVDRLLSSVVTEFDGSPVGDSLSRSIGTLRNIKADLESSYKRTDAFIETQFPDYYSAATELLSRFQDIVSRANVLSSDIMSFCGDLI